MSLGVIKYSTNWPKGQRLPTRDFSRISDIMTSLLDGKLLHALSYHKAIYYVSMPHCCISCDLFYIILTSMLYTEESYQYPAERCILDFVDISTCIGLNIFLFPIGQQFYNTVSFH